MHFLQGIWDKVSIEAQTRIPFIVEINVVVARDIPAAENQTLFWITCCMKYFPNTYTTWNYLASSMCQKRFMYTQLPALYFEHVMGLERLGMLLWRLVKNSTCWPDCSYQVTIKEIKICCKGLASFQWYLMTTLGVFRPVC